MMNISYYRQLHLMEDKTIKEINALFSDNCNLLPGYNARFLINTTGGEWWYTDDSPAETNADLIDCCTLTLKQKEFHFNLRPKAKHKPTSGNNIYAGLPVYLFDGQLTGVVFIEGFTDKVCNAENIQRFTSLAKHICRLILTRITTLLTLNRQNFHLHNSPFAIVEWVSGGIIKKWEGKAEKIFGWTSEEVIGKSFLEFQFVFEDDVEILKAKIDLIINYNTEYPILFIRNYTKNGKLIYCKWHHSVQKDEAGNLISLLIYGEDITEFKYQEDKLQFEQSQTYALINNINDIMYSVDKELRLLTANEAFFKNAEKALGRPRLIGEKILEGNNMGDALLEKMKGCFNRALKGQTVKEEVIFPNYFLNREFCANITWNPIITHDEVIGVAVCLTDITDQKAMVDSLFKKENELAFIQKNTAAIINNTSDIIYSIDTNFRILSANTTFEKITTQLFGKPKLTGDYILEGENLKAGIFAQLYQHYQSAFIGESFAEEIHFPDSFLGNESWGYAVFNPILDNGAITGCAVWMSDITARKKVEQQLAFEQQNTAALINNTTDIIFSVDTNLHLLSANTTYYHATKAIYGKARKIGELVLVPEEMDAENYKTFKEFYDRVLHGESFTEEILIPASIAHNDFWMEITFNPIYKSHQLKGAAVCMRDISGRKMADKLLKEKTELLEDVMEHLGEGFLLINNEFKIVFANPKAANMAGLLQIDFIGKSIEQLFPETVGRISFKHLQDAFKDQSNVFFEEYSERTKSWQEIAIFPSPDHISLFIRNITARKETSIKLQKDAAYLNALFNASTEIAMIATDLNGHITSFNNGAENILGYSFEEVKGISPATFHLESEMIEKGKELSAKYNTPIEGFEVFSWEPLHGLKSVNEWTYTRKDGSTLTILKTVSVIPDENGHPIGFLGVAIDITALKYAQDKLLKDAAYLNTLFNASSEIGMLGTDIYGNIISANTGIKTLYGYELPELIGNTPVSFQILDELIKRGQKLSAKYNTAIEGFDIVTYEARLGIFTPNEFTFIKKDGSYFTGLLTVTTINNAHGNLTGYLGTVIDITERKRAEDFLRETAKVARLGGWEYDLATKTISWTPMTKMLHEVPQDFVPTLDFVMNSYKDGECRDKIKQAFANAIEHGAPFDLELALTTAKGNEIWLRAKGNMEMVNNAPVRLYGMLQDITERKMQEESIKEYQQKLDAFFNSTNDIIVLLGPDMRILAYNKLLKDFVFAFLNRNIEVGDYILEYMPVDIHDSFSKNFRIALNGETIEETVFTPFKGEKHSWWHGKFMPMKNQEDVIIGVAFVDTNVTETKQKERALEEYEQKLAAFFNSGSDIVVLLAPDMSILAYNGMAEQFAQNFLQKQVTIGDTVVNYLHPATIEAFQSAFGIAISGEDFEEEMQVPFEDENYRWWHSKFTPMKNAAGEIIGVAFTDTNISEQKKQELAIQEQEQKLSAYFKSSNDIIVLLDLKLNILAFNKVAASFAEKFVLREVHEGDKMLDYILPSMQENFKKACKATLKGESVQDIVFAPYDDIRFTWWHCKFSPITNSDGVITGIAFTNTNITERKNADMELIKNEQTFSSLVQNTPGVVFRFHVKKDKSFYFSYVSHRMREIFDLEFPLNSTSCFDHINFVNKEKFFNSIALCVQDLSNWEYDGQLIGDNGILKWFNGKATPVVQEDEIVFIGILQDITAQKQAELEDQLMYNLLVNFNEADTMEEALTSLIANVNNHFNFNYAEAWSLSIDNTSLMLKAEYPLRKDYLGFKQDQLEKKLNTKGLGLPGAAWEKKEMIYWEDLQAAPPGTKRNGKSSRFYQRNGFTRFL